MKIIDNPIRHAFKELRKEYHSNSQMAEAMGLSDSMLSRIINGKAQVFTEKTWAKLEPLIRSHLRTTCHLGYAKCPFESNPLHELLDAIIDIDDCRWYSELLPIIKAEKGKFLKKHPSLKPE